MAEAEEIDLTDGTITVARLMSMDGADINLPDIDHSTLAQLTDDQFVTLLVKIYTSRDPQYMNRHISKIAWRIKQLPSDKVSAYIFQIMQHYRLSIDEMASFVCRTPVDKLCSDKGVMPSLALFIGLGHNGSNEGIVEIVNDALSSPQIMNYKQSTNMNVRGVPATRQLFVGGLPKDGKLYLSLLLVVNYSTLVICDAPRTKLINLFFISTSYGSIILTILSTIR